MIRNSNILASAKEISSQFASFRHQLHWHVAIRTRSFSVHVIWVRVCVCSAWRKTFGSDFNRFIYCCIHVDTVFGLPSHSLAHYYFIRFFWFGWVVYCARVSRWFNAFPKFLRQLYWVRKFMNRTLLTHSQFSLSFLDSILLFHFHAFERFIFNSIFSNGFLIRAHVIPYCRSHPFLFQKV